MLVVGVVIIGVCAAILLRRWAPTRDGLSTASSTILAVGGAVVVGSVVMASLTDPWRPWATLLAATVAAVGLPLGGAWVNRHAIDRLRGRRRSSGPGIVARLENWAESRPAGWAGGPVAVVVRSWHRATAVRVTGLAAEMTYYGLISLVPLLTALGSSLGYLGRIVGAEQVDRIEEVLVDAVSQVFAEQVAADVLAPLIEGLLRQQRAGFAIGSVLIALWLASRMFRAAIRALDDAYRVPERRSLVGQYVLGLALAVGAVVTLVVILTLVVVGPLLGDGQELAARLGLGAVFEFAWSVLRWPTVGVVTGAYLTLLYRYGPNVSTTWVRCLPGAVLGTLGLVLVAAGFSVYLSLAGLSAPDVGGMQTAAVTGAAQAIGMVLAGVLWLWLSSIALLLGGVLNAELDTSVRRPADRPSADEETVERREEPAGSGERPAGLPAGGA
ncbi:YihY/virulence factor BrkB family protein [Georgenia sunbinii]|uniref:YihY/virulence factor BrkB family protein n=1 Tax=Georgenia sunbinii TaxID=3117728 RepID=UPI002F25FA01